jgi:hypothetical protein
MFLCLKADMQREWESCWFNQLVQSGVKLFENVNEPDSSPHEVQQTHHNAQTLTCEIQEGWVWINFQ